jgi:transcriptional regulator with XRE-family HTH domain
MDKLARLTADYKLTRLSTRMGMHPNRLGQFFYKGFTPRADEIFRIAQVLGVSVEWLLDDKQGWPPKRGRVRRDLKQEPAPSVAA